MIVSRMIRPLLWVGLLSMALGGCYRWQAIPPPYDRSLDALGAPDVARVSTADGTVVVREPVVMADSIIGTDDATDVRYSVPVEAIEAIQLKRADKQATGWVIGLSAFAGFFGYVIIRCSMGKCGN